MEQKGVMQATVLPTRTAPNGAERCDAGNSFAKTRTAPNGAERTWVFCMGPHFVQ